MICVSSAHVSLILLAVILDLPATFALLSISQCILLGQCLHFLRGLSLSDNRIWALVGKTCRSIGMVGKVDRFKSGQIVRGRRRLRKL